MVDGRMSGRKLKKLVLSVLEDNLPDKAWQELRGYDPLQVINPLFTALLSPSPRVKWHAVSCFGRAVPLICREKGLERGRVVMRRFMWMLNDESGGIGWGVPESMAEVMASQETLAREFYSILFSFLQDAGGKDNYLEYAPLRRGAFWGAARLAWVRPDLAAKAGEKINAALELEEDVYILIGALLAASFLGLGPEAAVWERLARDERRVSFYWEEEFYEVSLPRILSQEFPSGGRH
ncbi:MAG: DVU0298 family protein [Desulfonatronovibrionaceae bacterium]